MYSRISKILIADLNIDCGQWYWEILFHLPWRKAVSICHKTCQVPFIRSLNLLNFGQMRKSHKCGPKTHSPSLSRYRYLPWENLVSTERVRNIWWEPYFVGCLFKFSWRFWWSVVDVLILCHESQFSCSNTAFN